MKKDERLLKLIAVLLATKQPLTADDLRHMIEGYPENKSAFRRSFERDKDELRRQGVPLKVERTPNTEPPIDGYRIDPDDYYLADPELDADELAALHLAALSVNVEGLDEQDALRKLGGLGGGTELQVEQLASLPVDPSLAVMFAARAEGMSVTFGYNDEPRRLDPWRLSFQRGHWYVWGYDHDRQAERNFRLDRVTSPPESTGEPWLQHPVNEPSGRIPEPWKLGEGEPVDVVLLVDSSHAEIVARQLGDEVKVSDTDRGAEFTIPVLNRQAFLTFVLGLGERAEILSPPDVRAQMVSRLQGVAATGLGER